MTPELKSCPQMVSYLQELPIDSELVDCEKKDLIGNALDTYLRKTIEVLERELLSWFYFALFR